MVGHGTKFKQNTKCLNMTVGGYSGSIPSITMLSTIMDHCMQITIMMNTVALTVQLITRVEIGIKSVIISTSTNNCHA